MLYVVLNLFVMQFELQVITHLMVVVSHLIESHINDVKGGMVQHNQSTHAMLSSQ